MTAQRIHVIGGPGSGKTCLALQLAARTGAPVHHLDNVARVGGGNGLLRPLHERERLVAEIAAAETWITDGIHLGWSTPLLERADLIVWLDQVGWLTASKRISRRFTEGGIREARAQTGRRRMFRFRDYGRHARALGGAVLEARRYYAASGDGAGAVSPDDTLGSRAATQRALAPYSAKVMHCRTEADVASILERVTA